MSMCSFDDPIFDQFFQMILILVADNAVVIDL